MLNFVECLTFEELLVFYAMLFTSVILLKPYPRPVEWIVLPLFDGLGN